ncbi:hypothetical protein Tcan_05276 [Toxocara canis]|uniref:Transmembrane protein n=1 Tax=Toxocara canis TaxID=6265 RepID=A0A0B2VHV1_TOXCA|nr:hypothetical protein Tcan_05276 [Toxocara canis]
MNVQEQTTLKDQIVTPSGCSFLKLSCVVFVRSDEMRSRRRLDTNRTAESLDSGVYSLDSRPSHSPTKGRRPIQLDDVLWCCAFALTIWYFDVPVKLLVDERVNRLLYLMLAVLLQMVFFSIGVFLFVVGRNQPMEVWPDAYPKLFPAAISAFLAACIMFCSATWNVWNFWSIYIVFVTFMFTIVVVSLV